MKSLNSQFIWFKTVMEWDEVNSNRNSWRNAKADNEHFYSLVFPDPHSTQYSVRTLVRNFTLPTAQNIISWCQLDGFELYFQF